MVCMLINGYLTKNRLIVLKKIFSLLLIFLAMINIDMSKS